MSLINSATRTLQLVSGSNTTRFTYPNKFTLSLPSSGFRTANDEVALKSMSLYYSWPNISAVQGNNSFSYRWGGTTFPVVLADGIWQFHEIMAYFQQVMYQNGHYLIDAAGTTQYYINFVVNSVLYCLSLVVTPLPSSLPAGWSNPANVVLSGQTPQLIIPSSMVKLTGFAAATYPATTQSTQFQLNSDIPQISDVSSMNVISSLVNNSGLSLTPNVLMSFVLPSDQGPGTLIQLQPANLDWVPVSKQQTFSEIEIEIVDQLMRPIIIRDPSGFVLTLNVRKAGV